MTPEHTIYRLSTEADEPQIQMLRDGDVPRAFPTVVAERDSKIIGFLGTHALPNGIVAGPLTVDLPSDRARGIVALRLIQTYEFILMQAPGITSYLYSVDGDAPWAAATGRCDRTHYIGEVDGLQWFERRLPVPQPSPTVH